MAYSKYIILEIIFGYILFFGPYRPTRVLKQHDMFLCDYTSISTYDNI